MSDKDIGAPTPGPQAKGIIAWFTNNSVAANLLMVLILCAGLASAFTIKKRLFPDFAINSVVISVPYPGAAPADIEQSILLRVEEALRNVRGVDEVISRAWDGMGRITVKNGVRLRH